MLRALDVGNTQTHIGMFDGQELVEHWRLATDPEATADALATVLSNLLALRESTVIDIASAVVWSVVPVRGPEYEQVSERYLGGALAVVGPNMKIGMPIRM